MWVLPSKNRPGMCEKALRAFSRFGSTKGILWVDGDPYPNMPLPKGWVMVDGKGGAQAGAYRFLFDTYPEEPWYGFLADDNYAKTKDFDRQMIEAAEPHYFVSCSGGRRVIQLNKPSRPVPSAMVWGGDLVRAAGFIVHPRSLRAGTDALWARIARDLGLRKHLPNVIVDHPHPDDGNRKRDATDMSPAEPELWSYINRGLEGLSKQIASRLELSTSPPS